MQTRILAVPLLGAIAALLIILVLSVAPAFGQTQGDDVQYDAVCQNILGSVGDITQGQGGTASAASRQYSEAVAEVAQAQGVSIAQVNECLNGAAGTDGDDNGRDKTDRAGTGGDDDRDVRSADGVLASTIPDQKVLANTGGPALLLPALGLLLISSVALRNLLRR